MSVIVETERLVLREWQESDRDWAAAQAADPIVMEHLGGTKTRADSDARIDRMTALQAARGHGFWVIERKADGRPIGTAGIKLIDAPGAPMPGELEVGWRLDRDCWGQGYAREAAAAALDFAFGTLGGARVMAITSDRNAPSWGLMERLGMTRRRDLDFDDPRFGPADNPTITYSIDAAAWRR